MPEMKGCGALDTAPNRITPGKFFPGNILFRTTDLNT